MSFGSRRNFFPVMFLVVHRLDKALEKTYVYIINKIEG